MSSVIRIFMEEDYQKILRLIAKKRSELGISQFRMGEVLGLTESGYFKVEKGKSRLDLMRFIIILNKLGITPQDFFTELENTTPLEFLNREAFNKK